jgi:hypothetical protein
MNSSLHAHHRNIYKGHAVQHVEYVTREGRHRNRKDLVATGELNLPPGADSFRQIAVIGDRNERSGGIVLKEWEVALPRGLTDDQKAALATDMAVIVTQGRPAQWAIHNPTASDGGCNPHVHLAYLPRKPDRKRRPLDLICSRHNPQDPSSGGWKKDRASSRAAYGLKLRSDRLMFEEVINNHLARAGRLDRVSSKSFSDRGIDETAGAHLYQSGLRRMKSLQTAC